VLTVYLPEATATATLADLRDNGEIAITLSRAVDHRSVQVKGTCAAMRPGTGDDRAVQERYREAFLDQLQVVGLPRKVACRIQWWPSIAVDVVVRELYEQTPGPKAGQRLEGRAGP
jgi:hypothetical protein